MDSERLALAGYLIVVKQCLGGSDIVGYYMLLEKMTQAGLVEQVGWDLFYHGNISLDEVIAQLEPHLQPSDEELAVHIFRQAVKRAPDQPNPLPKEQFHFLATRSLIQLAALRSDAIVAETSSLIAHFPDKTETVCMYLSAVVGQSGRAVVAALENVIQSDVFTTPWQQAWLCRVLARGANYVSEPTLNTLIRLASSDSFHWISRVEAMKVLAWVGELDRRLLTRGWELAPRAYRVDLLESAAAMSEVATWARKFLSAARLDPVEQVVARHVSAEDPSGQVQVETNTD